MARLLSVNVGLPRDIEWKGRTVHTGIWKDPVRGRCRVGRLNVEDSMFPVKSCRDQEVSAVGLLSYPKSYPFLEAPVRSTLEPLVIR